MQQAQILVELKKSHCKVKMIGRPTFATAGILRKLSKKLAKDKQITSISIGMKDCEGMDSTIMGILTTLALKIRARGGDSIVLNPGSNKQLLNGLGLGKIFQYVDDLDAEDGDWHDLSTGEAPPVSPKENVETILDAHKTLMDADEGNVDKFKKVVDMLEKELEE